MRQTTATIDTAIDDAVSFRMTMKASVEPSYIYVDTLDYNNTIVGADADVIIDTPFEQEIHNSSGSGGLFTFWSNGSYVQYICETWTGVDVVTTTLGCDTKPGILGDYIFYSSGSGVYRAGITWSDIEAHSTSPFTGAQLFSGVSGTVTGVYALSSSACAVITYDDGGMRIVFVIDGESYSQPGRFMFPIAIDYTDNTVSGALRTPSSLGAFSGAVELGEEWIAYLSNPFTGSVEGISYNYVTGVWSDIFTAVNTDLQSSLCEFRVANAYTYEGKIYLAGQFRRTENVETAKVYNMVLPSSTGRSFSLNSFTLVSQLGYRFHARVYNSRLYLGSCNRTASKPLTWPFAGNSEDGLILQIPTDDFISFQENNVQEVRISFRAGNDVYAQNDYVTPGSRLKLYVGYNTSEGTEYVLYGTYIIEQSESVVAQGERSFFVTAVQLSEWMLSGLSSPFYAEFFSKSSMYDPLTEESGNFYVAASQSDTRSSFSVDFWNHTGYDNSEDGITGLEMMNKGGVTNKVTEGSHRYGIKCRELNSVLTLADPVEFTEDDLVAEVHGWSHGTPTIDLVLWIEPTSGSAAGETIAVRTDLGLSWSDTYPSYSANDGEVLTFTVVPGVTQLVYKDATHDETFVVSEGDKLHAVGITCTGSGTDFSPARIDVTAGAKVSLAYTDANTPWTQTGSGLELPGLRRPYVMFSQKPYDAWNFMQVASFTNTARVPVSYFNCSCGLVGLALDGINYIVGRYDYPNNKWQIVKVRNNEETVLAQATPSGTVSSPFLMGFSHRDGTFSVWWSSGGVLSKELSYSWKESDGWMFDSETVSKKCGIYGVKAAPWFETVGADYNTAADIDNCEGIPMMPGYSLSGWPEAGIVNIGETELIYNGKIVADTIGPHQFRNSGKYGAPYGNGSYGLEFTFLDWQRSSGEDAGKFCAVDNGGCYMISGGLYQVWNKTGGVTQYLHNRARLYSDNSQISKNIKMLSNRVYITGGLDNVIVTTGKARRIKHGELCILHVDGDIKCHSYRASSGQQELTIRDLVGNISEYAGVSIETPGDYVLTSGSPTPGMRFDLLNQYYVDGFDVRFSVPGIEVGEDVEVLADVVASPQTGEDDQLSLRVSRTGSSTYTAELVSWPSETVLDKQAIDLTSADRLDIRVVFHDDFATLDIGNCWMATFGHEGFTYNQACSLFLRTSAALIFSNVRAVELSDWREAIYIDLETDCKAAIASVIQERPVETCHRSDGSIAYWYTLTRERIVQTVEPRRHSSRQIYPRNCSSDGIIYYSEVSSIQNTSFASRYGFSTKVYRFPSLTVGAIRAARVAMDRALEQSTQHVLTIRPDVRIEVGDVLDVDYTASGTEVRHEFSTIVEGVSLSYSASDSNPVMTVTGREEL